MGAERIGTRISRERGPRVDVYRMTRLNRKRGARTRGTKSPSKHHSNELLGVHVLHPTRTKASTATATTPTRLWVCVSSHVVDSLFLWVREHLSCAVGGRWWCVVAMSCAIVGGGGDELR
jgi:hypothetical protein